MIDVRPATPDDAPWCRATLAASWGGPLVAVHDELIDASAGPALVAWRGDDRVGLLTWRRCADESVEVLTLDATRPGAGVGTALLAALERSVDAPRLWLITTNENTAALRFYQRRGWDLVAIHRDAVSRARRLKPAIPEDVDGIPVRHELELERMRRPNDSADVRRLDCGSAR